MLDISYYSEKWAKEPISISELVRLALPEENVESFLAPVVSRLDGILSSFLKADRENPLESLIKRNRFFIENLRYWRICELQHLPLPIEDFSHELKQELEAQRAKLEPKLKAAREREAKLTRIAWLQEHVGEIDKVVQPQIDLRETYQKELAQLQGGK